MYEIDEQLTERIYRVMQEHASTEGLTDFAIVGLRSDRAKTSKDRDVYADCRTVPELWSAFVPYDFIITVYEPNIAELDEHQIDVLLWHELLHCDIAENGTCRIKGHDIEDFREIIEAEGLDWSAHEQTTERD